jgi:HK97 family phage major capsid protein
MATAKELRAQRAKLVADARAIMDKAEVTAEDSAQFDTLMAKADEIKGQIDRVERAENAQAELDARIDRDAHERGVSTDEARADADLAEAAFNAYMRGGFAAMTDEQRAHATARFNAAQSTGTGSAGGYTVPTGFYTTLEEAMKAYGGMLDMATIIRTTTGNSLPMPTANDTNNSGAILTENAQVGNQDTTFGAVTLGAYTYTSKLVLVSNQLLQDSEFDLNSYLAKILGVRIARAINTHFTVGTGTAQPMGCVTAAALGKTGAVGQTTSILYDDLVDLQHSVDPEYRRNATFMFADSTLKVLKKMKDSQGRPLWLPGIATGEPDTILGQRYAINQDMPVMAANAKSVCYGDHSKYMIRQVAGTQVLRLTERYADYNQTGFLAFQRWDGNLLDAGMQPIKYYANSAT